MLGLFLITGITTSPFTNVFGQETSIPSWVKTNTFAWGKGQTSDYYFIQSLQWLIDQKILKTPATDNSFNFDPILKLATLESAVGNETYAYDAELSLFENGSITTPNMLNISDNHLQTMINLQGQYNQLEPPLSFKPSFQFYTLSVQSELESDKLLKDWITTNNESTRQKSDAIFNDSQNYETQANQMFAMEQSTYHTSPSWIKNTATWWGEGQISDAEFIQTMQWLIDNNIFKITPSNS